MGVWDEGGKPLRHEVSYPGRYVKIKAWVPGAVDTKKTVTIVYRVRRGILNFEDHDELYWNATGDEWEVLVLTTDVFVKAPPGVADDGVRAVAYTGPRGASGQDYRLERVERFWRFTTTRALRPREGVTVVVGWPVGHVGRPSAVRQGLWFLGDNWPLGLPLLALLAGWLAWWAYGRDPGAKRSVKPEYEPPLGLLPAEAGPPAGGKGAPPGPPPPRAEPRRPPGPPPPPPRPAPGPPPPPPPPPTRDRLYRMMVEHGLFPTSPANMRADWLFPGGALLALAFVLPQWGPAWLAVYGFEVPAGLAASRIVLMVWSRFMARRTLVRVPTPVAVRRLRHFLERADEYQHGD